jgi:hypothetical protein
VYGRKTGEVVELSKVRESARDARLAMELMKCDGIGYEISQVVIKEKVEA